MSPRFDNWWKWFHKFHGGPLSSADSMEFKLDFRFVL